MILAPAGQELSEELHIVAHQLVALPAIHLYTTCAKWNGTTAAEAAGAGFVTCSGRN